MQGMNSRTQMSITHVTNYTNNTRANLQSISNLDLETRGEEKNPHAVFQSKTLALWGHTSCLLSKTQGGSHSVSENEQEKVSFPFLGREPAPSTWLEAHPTILKSCHQQGAWLAQLEER